jgi:hypothetical protein
MMTASLSGQSQTLVSGEIEVGWVMLGTKTKHKPSQECNWWINMPNIAAAMLSAASVYSGLIKYLPATLSRKWSSNL